MADDTIYRQAAIDIVSGYAEQFNGYIGSPNDSEVYAYARGLLLSIERNINAIPSAQPTLYGYSIEHLALIARVMQKEHITPEKAIECFKDLGRIVQMIIDEQQEMIKRAVEKWTV